MKYLETENIEIHKTRAHPFVAERFIRRQKKDMLFKRIERSEKRQGKHTMD